MLPAKREVRTDPCSWTDHAEPFHHFPGVKTCFILLGTGRFKDVLGQRSRVDLRQIDPVVEVLSPLPDPDRKRVLRRLRFVERALGFLPLQIDDGLIPVL
jgi:hypothetical protein